MKFNKTITIALATLIFGSTSFLSAETQVETRKIEPMILAYYGQVNSNGTVRTKRVNGYFRSNGTYVNSYYRS